MSVKCIVCFSVSILLFSSNLFSDTFPIPTSYDYCFDKPYYLHDSPPHEEALAIGECFYLAAENILIDDNKGSQHETSSSRTHIISALQYADSWFRLAIQKGNTVAITYLHHTELYLIEGQQKHPLKNLIHASITEDTHATTY